MSSSDPVCPMCKSVNVYRDGNLWTCPECGHEWNPEAESTAQDQADVAAEALAICDAFGTPLADGDSVTVIKELRIKGSSSSVKVGTKVKNIRLNDAGDGHDISCRIDGLGSINLKSEFVRKA